jgi:hypothetical protein
VQQCNIVACYLVTRQITYEFWIWHSVYLLEYSPGGTTVSRFTILRHINFTFWLYCSGSSPVSTELISTPDWCFTVDLFDPSLLTDFILHPFKQVKVKSKSHWDWRSVNKQVLVSSPIWGSWLDIYYCLTITVLFLWGALSDERTGLSFIYAAGLRQRSLSWVPVPRDSWPYFTVSDLRLPFSSPPTTRRVTVEVFEPASTRLTLLSSVSHPPKLILCRPESEHLLEPFNFPFTDASTASVFVTTESHC